MPDWLNISTIAGVIARILVAMFSGILIAKLGWTPAHVETFFTDTAAIIAIPVLTLGTLLWSLWQKHRMAKQMVTTGATTVLAANSAAGGTNNVTPASASTASAS